MKAIRRRQEARTSSYVLPECRYSSRATTIGQRARGAATRSTRPGRRPALQSAAPREDTMLRHLLTAVAVLIAIVVFAREGRAQDGALLYAANCSVCHDGGIVRAPQRRTLSEMTPERIVAALEGGSMRAQGASRTPEERRAIAVFLTGKPLGSMTAPNTAPRCTSAPAAFSAAPSRAWTGRSPSRANDRYQAQPGALTAADVPKLKVKWAFGFAGDTSAAVQPTIVNGRVFVGSTSGRIYALSLRDGCAYWTFDADQQVRTAIAVGREGTPGTPVVFFADVAATIYSLDATTGQLRWKKKAEDHPLARVTGTPKFLNGRLYVPLSSLEELAGAEPKYSCCTFRGSVLALNASTGDQIWRTYTIGETPKPVSTNRVGTQLYGPSGAAVWSSPTIDVARQTIYIGTGDSYSQPAAPTSDAVMALDLNTGAIKWVSQLTSGDAWNLACGGLDSANCPAGNGPDFDFGSPPMLVTLPSGERRLIVGQKSGVVHGLDANTGKVLWSTRIGKGGVLGGVEWGSSTDGRRAYVALSDQTMVSAGNSGAIVIGMTKLDPTIGGGLFALNLTDGTKAWNTPPPGCGEKPM